MNKLYIFTVRPEAQRCQVTQYVVNFVVLVLLQLTPPLRKMIPWTSESDCGVYYIFRTTKVATYTT